MIDYNDYILVLEIEIIDLIFLKRIENVIG